MAETVAAPEPTRKVGFLLGVGILLLPYIFAWLLLRRGYSTLARVVSFGWLGLVVIIAFSSSGDRSTPSRTTSPSTDQTTAAAPLASSTKETDAPAKPSTNWRYSESKDEMRGATTYYAEIVSENELNFDFPYNGGSAATLTVRKSPVHGTDVMLRINGQFMCNTYSDDYVSVKFDSGPIQRFSCGEPSDGTTGVLFIQNAPRFIAAAKKADRVVIEAEFYQEGNRQLVFNTAGLDWSH